MLTREQNDRLAGVGPGAPMEDYLRRNWHPVAGASEFEAAMGFASSELAGLGAPLAPTEAAA